MKYSERIYNLAESCIFRKTREAFGGLSNMSTDYPLEINGIRVPTTEALYQACRYPHLPEVQMIIINQTSPMTAKMKSKAHYEQSREDWEEVKVAVMRWCLRVKLAHHFLKFGLLLESTVNKNIVEESKRDKFWGAQRIDQDELRGVNALGRLLMELRQLYCSENRYSLLYIEPPRIHNFMLLDKQVEHIDKRLDFVLSLIKIWQREGLKTDKFHLQVLNALIPDYYDDPLQVSEDISIREAQNTLNEDEQETPERSKQRTSNLSLF